MEIEYLPYNNNELPISKDFDIFGSRYTITLYYNDLADIYTIIISKDENVIFSGKLTYCRNAIDAVVYDIEPDKKIIPLLIDDALRNILRIDRISKYNFDSMRLVYEVV